MSELFFLIVTLLRR